MTTNILTQLRQQPVIAGVTVIGTALSIMLIMVVVMSSRIHTASYPPESHRDRFLHYPYVSFGSYDWGSPTSGNYSNGPMSAKVVDGIFYKMETPEAVSAYTFNTDVKTVAVAGAKPFSVDVRDTDAAFFRVFDFDVISGKPYTQEEFEAGLPVAVIDAPTARRLFGTTDAAGREMLLNGAPYRVSAVVKAVSPIANYAYGQVWASYKASDTANTSWSTYGGPFRVTMLCPDRPGGMEEVREECDRVRTDFEKEMAEAGWFLVNLGRPYTQEKAAVAQAANLEPDPDASRRTRLIIYALLLLVPAINLSSMTHSRLCRRAAEIAVRRAFGQTRTSTAMMLLGENMVITLIGGAIGLLLSLVVAFCFADSLFMPTVWVYMSDAAISPAMLIQWGTFGWALLFCFILNLLSAGIPAWRASRIDIVASLRG